ncbi:MAG TPA: hypothetical protein VMU19_07375 [Bryobacteraceae bacterium]|nr:hypothetical protein [Bryobacteraceae bacterium]
MRKRAFAVIGLTIAFLAGSFLGGRSVRAQTQNRGPRTSRQGVIPGSWGDFRGVSDNYLVFQDRNGVIRMWGVGDQSGRDQIEFDRDAAK